MARKLTNDNWQEFSQRVAMPQSPDDFSPAAMTRLMKHLDPYIVDVKGIHQKYHSRNKIRLIKFSTPEEAKAYTQIWEDYLAERAKIEAQGDSIPGGHFLILVKFLKFRQAAELIRAPYLARELWDIVYNKGRSAVCACNFKETIAKITTILVDDYKVPCEEVSLIWGGMDKKKPKKKKQEEKPGIEIDEYILENFSEETKNMLRELGIIDDLPDTDNQAQGAKLVAEEDAISAEEKSRREMFKRLGLTKQSAQQRQDNIDKFQRDESKFCLFTFKSGGVGLSLHQEEPHRRQRESLLAPTYSAIELVQGFGRPHRITSCSDTDQTVVFYAGTIEVRVAMRTSQKMKVLRKVVRQRESWEDVIIGDKNSESEDGELPSEGEVTLEGGDLISDNDEESDEENNDE